MSASVISKNMLLVLLKVSCPDLLKYNTAPFFPRTFYNDFPQPELTVLVLRSNTFNLNCFCKLLSY